MVTGLALVDDLKSRLNPGRLTIFHPAVSTVEDSPWVRGWRIGFFDRMMDLDGPKHVSMSQRERNQPAKLNFAPE